MNIANSSASCREHSSYATRNLFVSLAAALLLMAGGSLVQAAANSASSPEEEAQLIAVLKSSAGPAEKDAACARLKFIGSPACVPALAALLADDQLSHSARYALEPMQFEAAGQALVAALPHTHGLIQVGILDSIGVRRELWAVPAVATYLGNSDPLVASAAAYALGQIGGQAALQDLRASVRTSSAKVHDAIVDAELRCANRLLASGQMKQANALFSQLYHSERSDRVRTGAYRGLILTSGGEGLKLVVQAIEKGPAPAQLAALQLITTLQLPNTTAELTALLPKSPMPVQLALVEGLGQRGDASAAPALAALISHCAPDVRLAILQALDSLGSAANIPLLAGFAATGAPDEQKVAREALADLRRGNVTETLLGQLSSSTPAVQAELVRALGSRGDRSALPELEKLAREGSAGVQRAAFQALGLLVDNAQLPDLVALVLNARDPSARNEGSEALNVTCQRIQSRRRQLNTKPIVAAVLSGSPDAQIALLPLCSTIPDPSIRAALRQVLQTPNPRVRDAANRALCDTQDPEMLDDVVSLARTSGQENFHTLATAAAVRLCSDEKAHLTVGRRLAALRDLYESASRPDQKRLVLAGLADIPDPDALRLVETALADNDVQAEASLAAIKIATALPSSEAQNSEAILQKAAAGAANDSTRQALNSAIAQIEANADYISQWQVAGPFSQPGKDYTALFDIIFPPELEDAKGVNWRYLPPAADPQRPWAMDLLKALGNHQQCVAYARTWVQSDADRDALLELGSDDGVKAWVNDKQVFALNTARALQPATDHAPIHLHSGWNQLLLKVTQFNQGWGFCARIRQPNGAHLEGLQYESASTAPSTPSGAKPGATNAAPVTNAPAKTNGAPMASPANTPATNSPGTNASPTNAAPAK